MQFTFWKLHNDLKFLMGKGVDLEITAKFCLFLTLRSIGAIRMLVINANQFFEIFKIKHIRWVK